MDIKDRFRLIMERKGLTAGAFADNIGVAQATISHILGGRNKYPSMDVILRLHERYGEINLAWLLTGEGTMSDEADGVGDYPLLFPENSEKPTNGTVEKENRKEIASETPALTTKEIVKQEIIYKETTPRKIVEIKIFYDNNTFETFQPAK